MICTGAGAGTGMPMKPSFDLKQYAVLYVDDETQSLKYFRMAFRDRFRILTADRATAGMEILLDTKDQVGVLITDQRMPGESGVELLVKAAAVNPLIGRILITAYSDIDTIVDAVNRGRITRYINKPWNLPDLQAMIDSELEQFAIQRSRRLLLQEKTTILYHRMISDRRLNLGLLSSGFSHHVRNAMVAAHTFLDHLPEMAANSGLDINNAPQSAYWVELYRRAKLDINRIEKLLDELADLANGLACRMNERVHLGEIVRRAIQSVSAITGYGQFVVHTDIADDLPISTGNVQRLQKLLELLLTDEIANLPANSEIHVAVRHEPASGAIDNTLKIIVADDGPNLSSETLDAMFDPFFVRSNNPREFGANLISCFFIAFLHGGDIDVRNNSGPGVTFTVTIPVNADERYAVQSRETLACRALLNEFIVEQIVSRN